MYLFIEKLLRGLFYITKRYNKYMEDYDPTKTLKYMSYLDMNNWYGWTVNRYHPYGGFNWLKNADKFDVNSVSENSSAGYILNVDPEYLDELHVLHNNYPLAPEKLAIPHDLLSDYCKKNC